jgi:hypothetical protein
VAKKKRTKCANCQTFHEGQECQEATNGDDVSKNKKKKQKKCKFDDEQIMDWMLLLT